MAKRRMFSRDIIETDKFLELPIGARLLYYDLGMRADDDGFISSPKRIINEIGVTTTDMKLLVASGYVIVFDDGIIVIRDWKINNQIRKDRHTGTIHIEHLEELNENKLKQYIPKKNSDRILKIESFDE